MQITIMRIKTLARAINTVYQDLRVSLPLGRNAEAARSFDRQCKQVERSIRQRASTGARARRPLVGLVLSLLLFVALAIPATAQDEVWRAHTSMREVSAVAASADEVWAASSGGLFRFRPATSELTTYTAAEGLFNVATEAVAYDARRNKVWTGYRTGVVDRLDVETGAVRTLRDVERAERFPARGINRLVMHGDSLFAATGFGVVLFDAEREEVRDSYTHFGSFDPGTAVHDVEVAPGPNDEPALWVATERGVAWAPLSATNLKVPDVWQTESLGSDAVPARTVAYFDGRVYVGADPDLWRLGDSGSFERMNVVSNPVTDLLVADGALVGATQFRLLRVDGDGVARMLNDDDMARPVVLAAAADQLWIGDVQDGLMAADIREDGFVEVQQTVVPDGPSHNAFAQMTVDDDGVLWAAAGDGSRFGFYRYASDGQWSSYNAEMTPALDGRDWFRVVDVDDRGHGWFGSFGDGLAELTPDGDIRTYDHTNSTLRGSTSEDYVLADGVAVDADGSIWVTNKLGPQPLHVYQHDGEPSRDDWAGLSSHVPVSFTYGVIFIDSFGQKWIAVHNSNRLNDIAGVVVLDTGQDPRSRTDDRSRFFNEEGSSSDRLPSTHVNVITEDRDGLIWVGTREGPAYLFNTGVVAEDPNAQFIRPQLADREEGESVFLLGGLDVRDIAVDPANQLWMATEAGLYLVEPAGGGFSIVEHFTAENSPLFSNDVQNVTVDPASGRVFVATDRGLLSYQGNAVMPVSEVQDLFVYPNPVIVDDGSAPDVCVRGLVEQTDVRVLRPDGTVVARSSESSGQFCWRGGSERAWYLDVPSGVYVIAAVGANGEGTAYGKVAIVR